MILGFTLFLGGLTMIYLGVVDTDLREAVEQFLKGNIIVRQQTLEKAKANAESLGKTAAGPVADAVWN